MRIIIQGDNRIATDLAVNLMSEGADMILVGQNPEILEDLADRYEIHCVLGRCSDPELIRSFDLQSEDTFITVTTNDELNLISCKLFSDQGVERCLCRLRNSLLGDKISADPTAFGVTGIFRPEKLVKEQMLYLIQHPGTFQHVELHDGLVQVLGVKARRGGPLVGRHLSDIPDLIPDQEVRVVAIYTAEGPLEATGETLISEGDDVFLVVSGGHEDQVIQAVHGREQRNKRIFIAGGGNIGSMLAIDLQRDFQVKLLEQSRERCDWLAEQTDEVIVLHGSSSDRDLMASEYIDEVDVFCAVTNDDESNYLSALMAKRLGAHHSIALINEAAYVELVEGREIDTVLVPSQISLGALLGLTRQDVSEARRLRRGAAEVLSIEVNGKAHGCMVGDLPLPTGASVGAVVRDGKMIVGHKDILVQRGDFLIVFLTDIAKLPELRRKLA